MTLDLLKNLFLAALAALVVLVSRVIFVWADTQAAFWSQQTLRTLHAWAAAYGTLCLAAAVFRTAATRQRHGEPAGFADRAASLLIALGTAAALFLLTPASPLAEIEAQADVYRRFSLEQRFGPGTVFFGKDLVFAPGSAPASNGAAGPMHGYSGSLLFSRAAPGKTNEPPLFLVGTGVEMEPDRWQARGGLLLGATVTANETATLAVPVERLTAVAPHRLGWIGLDPETHLGDLLHWPPTHPRAASRLPGRIESLLFLAGLLALATGLGLLVNREAMPLSRRFLAWLLFLTATVIPVSALGYLQDRLLSGGSVSFVPAVLSRGLVVFLLGLAFLQAGLRQARRHARKREGT